MNKQYVSGSLMLIALCATLRISKLMAAVVFNFKGAAYQAPCDLVFKGLKQPGFEFTICDKITSLTTFNLPCP